MERRVFCKLAGKSSKKCDNSDDIPRPGTIDSRLSVHYTVSEIKTGERAAYV